MSLVFFYKFINREVVIVTMYVDDFIFFSSWQDKMSELKRGLKERLDIRDLGPIKEYLGVRNTRDENDRGISLDQEH